MSKFTLKRVGGGRRRRVGLKRRVNKIARRVKNLEQSRDWKTADHTIGATNIVNTGNVDWVSFVDIGDLEDERTGNEIAIGSLQIDGVITQDNAGANVCNVSVYLVIDKDSNDAKPTIAGLLESATPLSHINVNSLNQYRILRKFQTTVSDSDKGRNFHFYYKWKKQLKTGFNDNAPVQATGVGAETNHLYLVTIGDLAAAWPQIKYDCRLRYTD